MKTIQNYFYLLFLIFIISFFSRTAIAQDELNDKLHPRVIKLNANVGKHQEVLTGTPGTVTMHSGLVVLEPDSSVGTHNTEKYEEVLIVLEGKGKMVITDGPVLKFESGNVAYCPPHSEHNVINTGTTKLKYLYIVAIAEAENEIVNEKSTHKK